MPMVMGLGFVIRMAVLMGAVGSRVIMFVDLFVAGMLVFMAMGVLMLVGMLMFMLMGMNRVSVAVLVSVGRVGMGVLVTVFVRVLMGSLHGKTSFGLGEPFLMKAAT